jgi:hypothetical protein
MSEIDSIGEAIFFKKEKEIEKKKVRSIKNRVCKKNFLNNKDKMNSLKKMKNIQNVVSKK